MACNFRLHSLLFSATLLLGANSALAESTQSLLTPYGFILPNINVESQAVDSFGNQNTSAPTAAHNAINGADFMARSGFQAAQSRFGIQIGLPHPVSKYRNLWRRAFQHRDAAFTLRHEPIGDPYATTRD